MCFTLSGCSKVQGVSRLAGSASAVPHRGPSFGMGCSLLVAVLNSTSRTGCDPPWGCGPARCGPAPRPEIRSEAWKGSGLQVFLKQPQISSTLQGWAKPGESQFPFDPLRRVWRDPAPLLLWGYCPKSCGRDGGLESEGSGSFWASGYLFPASVSSSETCGHGGNNGPCHLSLLCAKEVSVVMHLHRDWTACLQALRAVGYVGHMGLGRGRGPRTE